MEENSFKFTCNDKCVRKLIAESSYVFNLGYELNSFWILRIVKTANRISNSLVSSFEAGFYCKFNLIRQYGNKKPITVTVKFLEDYTCFYKKEVSFDIETSSLELEFGQITIARLQASKIDIVFFFKQNAKPPKSVQDVTFKKPDNLRNYLLCLLRDEHLVDVTLKCGSEAVQAHKLFLCARSPVFRAMFSSDMQESKTNTVTIDDMDTSSFHAWVDFVYGGEVTIKSTAAACVLLNASEKYEMKGLKEVCIEYLESVLSTENAVQLLESASLYDEQLKTKVIFYMSKHFKSLKDSKEWKDLKLRNPALALEVYSYNE